MLQKVIGVLHPATWYEYVKANRWREWESAVIVDAFFLLHAAEGI